MAKRVTGVRARTQRDVEALLVRTAQSLGRIIGSLRRELEGATARAENAEGRRRAAARNGQETARGAGHTTAARHGAAPVKGRRGADATKPHAIAGPVPKRAPAAAKKKKAGRQSGARRPARRGTGGET